MSEVEALEAAAIGIDLASDAFTLIAAIDAALAVKAPGGDPDIVAAQADSYGHVAQTSRQVFDDVQEVQTQSLPTSWRGQAADTATQALGSLRVQVDTALQAFTAASTALATWADQLRTAQHQDTHGQEQLQNAKAQLSQAYELFEARRPGRNRM